MATTFDFTAYGDTLLAAGEAINDRISDNIRDSRSDDTVKPFDPHQIQQLGNRAQDLFLKSKELFALTVVDLGKDVTGSITTIEGVTDKINDAITHVESVQKIVDITTDLVSIAGSILEKSFNDIPGKAKGLLNKLGVNV